MDGNNARERLTELDALRGIAAIAVLFFHYTWKSPAILPEAEPVSLGLFWGHYGVQLFFAISGFVIFMTLERTRGAADFLVSRFSRLFPAYWAGVALTSLLVLLLDAPRLAQPPAIALVNLTMLQGFLYLPSVDGVYWSLTVELAFYACMLGLWRLGLLGRIEHILVGWIMLKLAWWAAPSLPSRVEMLLVARHIPWFAIGIACYRVWIGRRKWRDQAPVLLFALAAVGLVDGAADAGVFVVVTAIFVLLAAGKLAWLDRPVLIWLGALSYPIYLVHQNIGYAVIAAAERLGLPPLAALVCAILTALVLAQAIHAWVEQPSLRSIREWWKNRGKLASA